MAYPINILSLCSGVGMLDCGIAAGLEHLGFRPRVLGYCERDAFAASVLLARMEDQSLEPAPVFCGDMRDLDARPLRGYADLVCAGLPCPAFSVAGRQAGLADERAWGSDDSPIPQFLRIVSECRPALVFIENVPPFVRGGFFRPVGEELSRLGYEIETPVFLAAEDVGASHRRERVFILAVSAGGRFGKLRQSSGRDGLADGCGKPMADGGCQRVQLFKRSVRHEFKGKSNYLDDASSTRSVHAGQRGIEGEASGHSGLPGLGIGRGTVESGRPGDRPGNGTDVPVGTGPMADAQWSDSGSDKPKRRQNRRTVVRGDGESMAIPPVKGLQERSRLRSDADEEFTAPERGCRIFAPGPGDFDGWNRVIADGEFDFRAPATQPGVRVLADGMSLVVDASRADQLRCGGNGCVPLCAAVAFVALFRGIIASEVQREMF